MARDVAIGKLHVFSLVYHQGIKILVKSTAMNEDRALEEMWKNKHSYIRLWKRGWVSLSMDLAARNYLRVQL
jgi:hypothetical protein